MQIKSSEIAQHLNGRVIGDPELLISDLTTLDTVNAGALVFVENEAYFKKAELSCAAAILVQDSPHLPSNKPLIAVANPFAAFVSMLEYLHPPAAVTPGI